MNSLLRWIRDNTLVAVGIVTMSTAIAAAFEAQEVGGGQYHTIAQLWPRLKPQTKADVTAALADGSISRWEHTALMREILDEQLAFEVFANMPVEPERNALIALAAPAVPRN